MPATANPLPATANPPACNFQPTCLLLPTQLPATANPPPRCCPQALIASAAELPSITFLALVMAGWGGLNRPVFIQRMLAGMGGGLAALWLWGLPSAASHAHVVVAASLFCCR